MKTLPKEGQIWGYAGAHHTPTQTVDDLDVTDAALQIYKRMRRHEREQGGPGGPEWWAFNAQLAEQLGLFGGMTVYEDPSWPINERPSPSALARFEILEAANNKDKKTRTFKYKWER